jgi:hypothetical protein
VAAGAGTTARGEVDVSAVVDVVDELVVVVVVVVAVVDDERVQCGGNESGVEMTVGIDGRDRGEIGVLYN